MENTMVYQDNFCSNFLNEKTFLDFLTERQQHASWLRVKSKDISYSSMNAPLQSFEVEEQEQNDTEQNAILNDTYNNTKLLLKTEDGTAYPVRSCAIKTILDRARISGNALNKVEKEVFARILNYCMEVTKGNALLRIADGKVSAVHGGDPSEYKVLELQELFCTTADYLHTHYPKSRFIGGFYEHALVTAVWDLSDERELLAFYQKALERHGYQHSELKAYVRLTSSDVGISGANLFPILSFPHVSRTVPLGNPLRLEHKAEANMELFTEKLTMIYALYTESLKGLAHLLDITISSPLNCMAGVCKKLGIPKKLAMEAIDLFKSQHGTGYCTAHDIYYGICDILFDLQCSGAPGSKLVQMEESISRAIFIRWQDYDVPGDLKW